VHTVAKLQRWALKLSVFNCTIEHISGELKRWAAILPRWGAGYKRKEVSASALMGTMFEVPLQVTTAEVTLPKLEDFLLAQKKAMTKLSHEAPTTQGQLVLRVYDDDADWIHSNAIEMQLRNCVAAHCGSAGHRRKSATLAIIEFHVRWPTTANDVQQFLYMRLLCKATEPGEFMPLQFAETLHSDKPGEIYTLISVYKGPSLTGELYVLILKDDASMNSWLTATKRADADTVVNALMQWNSAFGTSTPWISDQASNFKCEVIKKLGNALNVQHAVTPPSLREPMKLWKL
jgi:hypothetical protein